MSIVLTLIVGLAFVGGLSWAVADYSHTAPVVVVVRGANTHAASVSGFDWTLFGVIGTALGTTLLALATGWLAWSTHQDVRASQQIASHSAEQLRLVRESNELTRAANQLTQAEQFERLAPAVIAAVRGSAAWGNDRGRLDVEVINVGGGPAVNVHVTAECDPALSDGMITAVGSHYIPFLPAGEREVCELSLSLDSGRSGSVSDTNFRVVGTYLTRHGRPAGGIVDWMHQSLISPESEA